ncbi:hypothetical protein D3C83_219930 [compost metagenome]
MGITSLVTEPELLGAERGQRMVLRVGTIAAGRFVAALRAAGIEVDAPETAAGRLASGEAGGDGR